MKEHGKYETHEYTTKIIKNNEKKLISVNDIIRMCNFVHCYFPLFVHSYSIINIC